MIPESGNRFSDKIMRQLKVMIPESGNRFSDKIVRQLKVMIPKSGSRFFGQDHAPTKDQGRVVLQFAGIAR
jgi:hypothetical protein